MKRVWSIGCGSLPRLLVRKALRFVGCKYWGGGGLLGCVYGIHFCVVYLCEGDGRSPGAYFRALDRYSHDFYPPRSLVPYDGVVVVQSWSVRLPGPLDQFLTRILTVFELKGRQIYIVGF